MLKQIFISIFLIQTFILPAQIVFDFENGSLNKWQQSDSVRWAISSANSISGGSSLHHAFDNPSSGNDQISLTLGQLSLGQPVIWNFKIKHGYNPSSSNNWSVFLLADGNADFMAPDKNCNAYVLGVNFNGSDDSLKLWEKSGLKNEIIANTNFNWQENIGTNDYVDFQVTFTPPENWEIIFSKNGDTNEQHRASFNSIPHIDFGHYFGIYYEYSSSQDQKLWFDDLEIEGNFIEDTILPGICAVNVKQNSIEIEFTEPVDQNINLENSISFSPDLNYLGNWTSSTHLDLQLLSPLEESQPYSLFIRNIKDLSSNTIKDTTLIIQYSIARQNDIVITEFMADPTPPVSLPEEEFIEIYNRTEKTFDLTNYSIWVGEKSQIIKSGNIMPGEYLIICDDNDTEKFRSYSKIIEVTSLPNITKSSGTIVFRNNLGQLIHQLHYNDDVFRSNTKQAGGWTLEMIDPDNPCHFEGNWHESEDPSGGTPGKQNSIYASNEDFEPPSVENIFIETDTSILILLNEQVDSLYTAQNISINPYGEKSNKLIDLEHIASAFLGGLKSQKLYEINISGVKDCAGNIIDNTIYYPFAITEDVDSLDVVFNELMFEPEINKPEYVEIANVSGEFLDLNGMVLAKRKSTGEFAEYLITNQRTLVLPDQLIVLSDNNELIFESYSVNNEAVYVEMGKFPELTNTSAILALQDSSGNIIDMVEYDKTMHFELLSEKKGVSLEKVNPAISSLDKRNWQSASENVNFATPGSPNSQLLTDNERHHTHIVIEPEVFSPNSDGYNDELFIRYQFEETGTVMHIKIFDAKGRLINHLANNYLCGLSGEFIWHGQNYEGNFASNGIYLVYIEYFNLRGNVEKYKKTCVLVL